MTLSHNGASKADLSECMDLAAMSGRFGAGPLRDRHRGPPSVFHSQSMDTADLAALVPDLMARHPACGWALLSGHTREEDLVIELHPLAWPDRVATVRVNAGAEVF